MQAHGEMPRASVIDLWGSATLRTGGEEIAQGLALMGCRPTWEPATGRVTGIEVLPMASVGRPRVDVTWRISVCSATCFLRRSRSSMPPCARSRHGRIALRRIRLPPLGRSSRAQVHRSRAFSAPRRERMVPGSRICGTGDRSRGSGKRLFRRRLARIRRVGGECGARSGSL